jgi:hypothetical protein
VPVDDQISISNPYGFELGLLGIHSVFIYYVIVSVEQEDTETAVNLVLQQNYPNPFNPTTKIKFTIPSVGTSLMKFVQLIVYDVLGNEIATPVNEEKQAGNYEVEFDGNEFPSGIYFYRLVILLKRRK